jgi:uncharacterized protein (TIGR02145 family)
MKKIFLLSISVFFTFTFMHCAGDDDRFLTVQDTDGNVYQTVQISGQTWTTENLKTTKFNDGTAIVLNIYPDNIESWRTTTGTYQWASTLDLNNDVDEELPFDYYGAMYNEAAIASGKLAPKGWRIPTEEEWIALRNYLTDEGHTENEGTVLKSISGWNPFSGIGTDLYGFNGLPNGYVDGGSEPKADAIVITWATSDSNPDQQTRKVVNILGNTIDLNDQSTLLGSGIRLIKE